MRRTFKDVGPTKNKSRAKSRAFINSFKDKCVDCGLEFDPDCSGILQFDHEVAEEKLYSVGAMAGKSHEKIEAEAGKCQIRCKHCHILKTAYRREEHWVLFANFVVHGESCVSKLSERFKVSIEKINEIVKEKTHMRQVYECVHGKNWISVAVQDGELLAEMRSLLEK